mgnify:CR=1 FL=1
MIKLNKKELARIDKALDKSVLSFTKEVGNILKEKKVIPKNTGALEKSQKIRRIDRKMSYISYDVPYSARVYYGNPEESPSGPVKFKYRRKPRSENDTNPVNPHARARWIEDVLYDQKNAERFAKYVRMYLNELDYSNEDEYDWEAENEAGRMLAMAERYDDSAEANMSANDFFEDDDFSGFENDYD